MLIKAEAISDHPLDAIALIGSLYMAFGHCESQTRMLHLIGYSKQGYFS